MLHYGSFLRDVFTVEIYHQVLELIMSATIQNHVQFTSSYQTAVNFNPHTFYLSKFM